MKKIKHNSIHDKLRTWYYLNDHIIIPFVIVIILGLTLFKVNQTRSIDLTTYSENVELVNIDYKKLMTAPRMFSHDIKVDKYVFNLEYRYKNQSYQSKSVLFGEYLSPPLLLELEKHTTQNLIVKCSRANPEKAMVFLKS